MQATHILLNELDVALADLMQQQQPQTSSDAYLLAALTSYTYRQGHACLMLDDTLNQLQIQKLSSEAPIEQLSADWQQTLATCPWWQLDRLAPLCWQDNRLYLRRVWQDEQLIIQQLRSRLAEQKTVFPTELSSWLNQLFPQQPSTPQPDWQLIACALASRSAFSIITGGPGTGKTTTVVKLLALLQSLSAVELARSLRIGLAAPTGKAAARLVESIENAINQLPAQFQHNDLPRQAQTLHRWLSNNELAQLDYLLVDEASMIDLHLMAKLLSKLPDSCRLILLGDKDQLASVDAGAVLGQLCATAEAGNYQADTLAWLAQVTGQTIPKDYHGAGSALAQQTVMLRHSHRFDANSAIGAWASMVNRQDSEAVKAALAKLEPWQTTQTADGVYQLNIAYQQEQALRQAVRHAWQPLLTLIQQAPATDDDVDAWAKACLQQLSEFQLLCALREGYWGLTQLNQRIISWLGIEQRSHWPVGRVVMVNRNDYTLNLMNGDIGLCLLHPRLGKRIAFWQNQQLRWILPARLTQVEDAFAMSVHKSQGSEFKRVMFVLPEHRSPVLTKELFYTAITRAKSQFILAYQQPQAVVHTVTQSVQRSGGLYV